MPTKGHDVSGKDDSRNKYVKVRKRQLCSHVGTRRLERGFVRDRQYGIFHIQCVKDCAGQIDDAMMELCACAACASGEQVLHSVCPIVEL